MSGNLPLDPDRPGPLDQLNAARLKMKTRFCEILLTGTQHAARLLVMTTRLDKLSDQIRQAIEAAGVGRNALAKAAGIDRGAFSRFMAGKAGLGLDAVDALAALLGLRIVATVKRPDFPPGKAGRPGKDK